MKKHERTQRIMATLDALYPDPAIPLTHLDPFTFLVAVVLSAQTTDKKVNEVTPALFARAPTPAAMAALDVDTILGHIRVLGLAPTKAKNVKRLSELLVERHGGEVPRTRAELEALPGVGRKTANVVLNVAFGEPTMAVDTHIFRVSNRTGLAPGATPLAVEKQLLRRVPEPYRVHAHHWLILLGRYICQARKPRCYECPVASNCHFTPKTPAP